MLSASKRPALPRHLRRPAASYATFVLAVITSAGLVAAGFLILSPTFLRWIMFSLAPLPVVIDVMMERATWRSVKARAIRRELAQRGPLPLIDETPQRFRVRTDRRREPNRSRDLVCAESAQEQTL